MQTALRMHLTYVSRTRCSTERSGVLHRRCGTPVGFALTGVPVLQRVTPLRSVLRCARDTQL